MNLYDLLPFIERRLDGGERHAFGFLRGRLAADHRETERVWRELRRPLRVVAEGLPRVLPAHEVGYFRAVASAHISCEESALHLLAVRPLGDADRAGLARRMRERRVTVQRKPLVGT